jgi:hypothetical protein
MFTSFSFAACLLGYLLLLGEPPFHLIGNEFIELFLVSHLRIPFAIFAVLPLSVLSFQLSLRCGVAATAFLCLCQSKVKRRYSVGIAYATDSRAPHNELINRDGRTPFADAIEPYPSQTRARTIMATPLVQHSRPIPIFQT